MGTLGQGPPQVNSNWSALCQTLHDRVDQEDWESKNNTLREAATKVGIKKVGERTSLLWKLSEKKRAAELCFGRTYKGHFKKNARAEEAMSGLSSGCSEDMQRNS